MTNIVRRSDLKGLRIDLGLAGRHAAVNRHGAEQLQPLTTVVVFERDIAAENFQEISKTVGAQLIGRGLDGNHVLDGVSKQRVQHTRQRRRVHANGQVQILHAEADEALIGQWPVEVWPTAAHKQIDIARTKGRAGVVNTLKDAEILVEAQQALHEVGVAEVKLIANGEFGQLVGGQVEQRVDGTTQHRINTGVGIGGKCVAQGELEIALEVNEIGKLNGQIRDVDRTRDAIDADTQLDVFECVLDAVKPVAQPRRGGVRDAEVKVHQL